MDMNRFVSIDIMGMAHIWNLQSDQLNPILKIDLLKNDKKSKIIHAHLSIKTMSLITYTRRTNHVLT
jgi:hypothetical protein